MTFRDLRVKAGLSQADLGAAIGRDQTAIGKIELGKVPDPRHSTVLALAKALNTSADVVTKAIARSVRMASDRTKGRAA